MREEKNHKLFKCIAATQLPLLVLSGDCLLPGSDEGLWLFWGFDSVRRIESGVVDALAPDELLVELPRFPPSCNHHSCE